MATSARRFREFEVEFEAKSHKLKLKLKLKAKQKALQLCTACLVMGAECGVPTPHARVCGSELRFSCWVCGASVRGMHAPSSHAVHRGVKSQPVRLWWGPRPHAMRARQPVQRKHDWMIDTHVRTCSQPPLGPGGSPGALHSCTSMGGSTRACAAPPAHGLRVRHCTCCVLYACCRRSVPHC